MGRLRRSRHHVKDKSIKKAFRLANRTKDMDQRWDELQQNPMGEQTTTQNPDLPGLGQHYCIHCDRHFIASDALLRHRASKVHKRRVKELKERPFDPELDPC